MTILDALADRNLLGAAFPEAESWQAWRAFLAAVFALDLTDDQAAIYRQEDAGRRGVQDDKRGRELERGEHRPTRPHRRQTPKGL